MWAALQYCRYAAALSNVTQFNYYSACMHVSDNCEAVCTRDHLDRPRLGIEVRCHMIRQINCWPCQRRAVSMKSLQTAVNNNAIPSIYAYVINRRKFSPSAVRSCKLGGAVELHARAKQHDIQLRGSYCMCIPCLSDSSDPTHASMGAMMTTDA